MRCEYRYYIFVHTHISFFKTIINILVHQHRCYRSWKENKVSCTKIKFTRNFVNWPQSHNVANEIHTSRYEKWSWNVNINYYVSKIVEGLTRETRKCSKRSLLKKVLCVDLSHNFRNVLLLILKLTVYDWHSIVVIIVQIVTALVVAVVFPALAAQTVHNSLNLYFHAIHLESLLECTWLQQLRFSCAISNENDRCLIFAVDNIF